MNSIETLNIREKELVNLLEFKKANKEQLARIRYLESQIVHVEWQIQKQADEMGNQAAVQIMNYINALWSRINRACSDEIFPKLFSKMNHKTDYVFSQSSTEFTHENLTFRCEAKVPIPHIGPMSDIKRVYAISCTVMEVPPHYATFNEVTSGIRNYKISYKDGIITIKGVDTYVENSEFTTKIQRHACGCGYACICAHQHPHVHAYARSGEVQWSEVKRSEVNWSEVNWS